MVPTVGSDLAEDIERKAHNFLSDVQVKKKQPAQEVTFSIVVALHKPTKKYMCNFAV
jgi:hypothetical protein